MSKHYTAARRRRRISSLKSLTMLLCQVELNDFESGPPCLEHGHRQLVLAGQARCPILWGVMIIRMWLNGYQPKLFRRTIVNDLIAKGDALRPEGKEGKDECK